MKVNVFDADEIEKSLEYINLRNTILYATPLFKQDDTDGQMDNRTESKAD